MSELTLTTVPTVKVGLLMRAPAQRAFQALHEPATTSRFWYTKSSGPMVPGAELRWEWEMYGASTNVAVEAVEVNRRIAFTWDAYGHEIPTHVEFRFDPRGPDATYVEITEVGFTGDGDTIVEHVTDSTAGFTFVLSSLKAYLEHDLLLHITEDAHPDHLVA
jgi:uncharacterized protein YndB with AHSA1/START domain